MEQKLPAGSGTLGKSLYGRFRWPILLCMLAALPLVASGVVGALARTSSDPRRWAPDNLPEVGQYDWFCDRFGRDEITVVSWPGCTLDDPRAGRLAQALLAGDGAAAAPYFQQAVTGGEVFTELTSPPISLSADEARARLRGVLLGPDGRTSCLVLTVSAAGAADRPAAIEQIYRTAASQCGLSRDEIHIGGPTADGAAIAAESRRTLYQLAALSAVVVFAAVWWKLRSFGMALVIQLGALYSAAATIAFLHFTGGTMTLLMTNLVPLVFVLGVSGAIHLTNYYWAAERSAKRTGRPAAEKAIADGLLPCVLAAGTTAVGFLSLITSAIEPIRLFGLYAAFGMGVNLVMLLVYLPVGWELVGPSARGRVKRFSRSSSPLGAQVCKWHRSISIAGLLLAAGAVAGLFWTESTVKLQDRFRIESRLIRDYRWLEQNVAPLVPLEVVVGFRDEEGFSFARQIQTVLSVQRALERLPGIEATISAAQLLPKLPAPKSIGQALQRRIAIEKLERHKERLIDARLLALADGAELWRITARVDALNNLDYGYFVEAIRGRLQQALGSEARDVELTYTGAIPLVYKAQRQLLGDLAASFLLAFGVITVVMIGVFRSVRSGLLAMLPNLFPAVVVFGGMGWLGMPLDIGSVMTASIGLGIAVDDTFHFLTWFQRGLSEGRARRGAVVFAYQHCARAMIQTTVVCSLGILVFVFSSYLPTVRFSCLLVVLLGTALLGDLIVLPALLAGPLGRLFQPPGSNVMDRSKSSRQVLTGRPEDSFRRRLAASPRR